MKKFLLNTLIVIAGSIAIYKFYESLIKNEVTEAHALLFFIVLIIAGITLDKLTNHGKNQNGTQSGACS